MEIILEKEPHNHRGCVFIENTHAQKLIDMLNAIPSQVLRASQEVPGLTESSINLGVVSFCAAD